MVCFKNHTIIFMIGKFEEHWSAWKIEYQLTHFIFWNWEHCTKFSSLLSKNYLKITKLQNHFTFIYEKNYCEYNI